jgi:hypothetical protein
MLSGSVRTTAGSDGSCAAIVEEPQSKIAAATIVARVNCAVATVMSTPSILPGRCAKDVGRNAAEQHARTPARIDVAAIP